MSLRNHYPDATETPTQGHSSLEDHSESELSAEATNQQSPSRGDNASVKWLELEKGEDSDNLEEEIEHARASLALYPPPHPNSGTFLNNLAVVLQTRFGKLGDLKDLDEAIGLQREGLVLSHPHHSVALNNLGWAMETRFNRLSDPADLDKAISLHRDALVKESANKESSLGHLTRALYTRFKDQGDVQDLDEVIDLRRQALAIYLLPQSNRVTCLNHLANVLQERFEVQSSAADLEEAISLYKTAQTLCELPHPSRSVILNNLGGAMEHRFETFGDAKDLDDAIQLYKDALAQHESLHSTRSTCISHLARVIWTRFKQQGDKKDLDETIKLERQILALCEKPHPDHENCLNTLAKLVETRFEQQGSDKDLDEIIDWRRALLQLHDPPHPQRHISLNNLGDAIRTRFSQKGHEKDLDDAIALYKESLTLCPSPHQDHHMPLGNLGLAILTRFEHRGDATDLDEAINLHREVLALRPPAHPDHTMALNNLGCALRTKFDRQGDMQDLDEVIALHREALASCAGSSPNPDLDMTLHNLAAAVEARFVQRGDGKDLKEAIDLHRQVLALHPSPHPQRSLNLNNLASAIHTRFQGQHNERDLDEAIQHSQEALTLQPPPHPHRDTSLNNLALALEARFEIRGDINDLNKAIEYHTEALAIRTDPHPRRSITLKGLGSTMQTRFEKQRKEQDLEVAIQHYRESLALCRSPHPERGISLVALGCCLLVKSAHTKNSHLCDTAFALLQAASTYSSSPPFVRFEHAAAWAMAAVAHKHASSLAAYQTAIDLLPQVAALHLDVSSRQQMLSTVRGSSLASGAATCAIDLGQHSLAVELLEASRSVFWSQALQIQMPLGNLEAMRPDLFQKLKALSGQLEQASFREPRSLSTDKDPHTILSIEAAGVRYQQINLEWDEVIKSVRLLPGFEDFLRPRPMKKLQESAVRGPMVVLHCGKAASNAVIVGTLGVVACVPLPKLPHLTTSHPDEQSIWARLLGKKEGSDLVSADEVLAHVLSLLWDWMVLPIFEVLELKRSSSPPRLWWCPTGPFTFLPIHAAGNYRANETNSASDYIISSFTPTITALLDPPSTIGTLFKMTAVIQERVPDLPSLPGAREELKKIIERVPSEWLTSLGDRTPATVETALDHLGQSSLVHFACHGVQDSEQPLDSGLVLHDGRLKVSQLMRRRNMPNINKPMSLAFLSACETAKGDETVPDEAMHLAATQLFAGFRGIVATMWTINDRDGPIVADAFYEHLFKDSDPVSSPPVHPDLTKAAEALHLAVLQLRQEPGISFKRWVPFVHYGL
ncbi:CHAT domain-containing protein [Mycena polygramma]|nr:CHAT domain-containing protein [Mycena polygramma]